MSAVCLSKAVLSLFFLNVSYHFCKKHLRHQSDKGGSATFTKQVKPLYLLLLYCCFSFVTTQTSNKFSQQCILAVLEGRKTLVHVYNKKNT